MAQETSELRTRAQRLFAVCDKEDKGFVTKRDMQRMQDEIPLEPEQLAMVFDSLDSDGNGYLTFDEFIQGFGIYMEEEPVNEAEKNSPQSKATIAEMDVMEDDENFMQLLDQLGGPNVFEDETAVKTMWEQFRQDDPRSTFQFEKFLSSISDSIHSKEKEKVTMEEFIRIQNETHEEEMKRLYEEMERQIEEEKNLVIRMERMKEQQLRNEMREEIAKKDQQLAQFQARQQELQEALDRLQESETISKQGLGLLSKEKNNLEVQLEIQTRKAEEFKSAMEQLRRESANERRQRAMAALNVAENIAVEREGLVEQLSLLKNINTRLTDENDLRAYGNGNEEDMVVPKSLGKEIADAMPHVPSEKHNPYLETDDEIANLLDFELPKIVDVKKKIQTNEEDKHSKTHSLFDELVSVLDTPSLETLLTQHQSELARGEPSGAEDLSIKTFSTEILRKKGVTVSQQNVQDAPHIAPETQLQEPHFPQQLTTLCTEESTPITFEPRHYVTLSIGIHPSLNENANGSDCLDFSSSRFDTISSDSIIGYHEGQWTHRVELRKREAITPSAVFKIIVLGESGVGKTSFIRRFCCGDYVSDCGSTVGIDMSLRCVSTGDGKQAALQFWDTAGKRNRQEKYNSISRQFLRKADGVVIMYDVTSETSFIHVRYWIDSIREVLGEEVACVLVGNKTDLLEPLVTEETSGNEWGNLHGTVTLTRHPTRIPTIIAMQLAQSMGLDFFETSAKTGYMTEQAIVAMVSKLQLREKLTMEKIILENSENELQPISISAIKKKVEKNSGKKCC